MLRARTVLFFFFSYSSPMTICENYPGHFYWCEMVLISGDQIHCYIFIVDFLLEWVWLHHIMYHVLGKLLHSMLWGGGGVVCLRGLPILFYFWEAINFCRCCIFSLRNKSFIRNASLWSVTSVITVWLTAGKDQIVWVAVIVLAPHLSLSSF